MFIFLMKTFTSIGFFTTVFLVSEIVLASESTLYQSKSESETNPWGEQYTGSTDGAGNRDSCPHVDINPAYTIGLMPITNWGRTANTMPTFWFYLPYLSTQIHQAEFTIQDELGEEVLGPITFDISDTPGMMSITLPHTSSYLNLETDYNWILEIYCSANSKTPISLEGWIEIMPSHLETSPQNSTVDSLTYQSYWENRVWFDAIHTLTQLRFDNPNDDILESDWIELLKDAGLEPEIIQTLVTIPFSSSIQLEN